jgi:transposase
VIDEQLWAEARRLFHVEHLSKSEIARRLQLDRSTVTRALGSEVAPQYARQKRGSMVLPHLDAVRARLREYPDISAARLLSELRALGYRGGYTALKEVVRELRPRSVEAFLRRETEPGQEAQVDWGSFGVLEVDSARRPLSCFVMVLGYSRMLFLCFTVSQRMEDFLRCHVDAFYFFGGVPHRILYDNLRSVVLARSGTTVRFHPRFSEFAGTHLFEPRPCGVRKPHEKGKVERAIQYIRNSFFNGRSFTDLSDLNLQAARWRDQVASLRLHASTRERPIDLFPRDRAQLLPLPARPFDTDIVIALRSTQQCLVHFDGNAYSVPFQSASRSLLLRATASRIAVFDKDRLVAEHLRCYGRHRVIERPDHVRRLLERKRAASAVKSRDLLLALCAEGRPFLDGLLTRGRRLDAHLSRIAELVHQHGPAAVSAGIAKALEQGLFGAGYVEEFIRARSSHPRPPAEVSVPHRPVVAQTHVLPHRLEVYDHDDSDP